MARTIPRILNKVPSDFMILHCTGEFDCECEKIRRKVAEKKRRQRINSENYRLRHMNKEKS